MGSDASIVLMACGSGGKYNGGVSLVLQLARKMKSTVFAPQAWSISGPNLFSSDPKSQIYTGSAFDPIQYRHAYSANGSWTKAAPTGSVTFINNVYFDNKGNIKYSQRP